MRGTWVVSGARLGHMFIPEPITKAVGCWEGPALGNLTTPPSEGVESSWPISKKDSEGEADPQKKPGRWD